MEWLIGAIIICVAASALIFSNHGKAVVTGANSYGSFESRDSNPNYQLLHASSTQELEAAIKQGADVNHLHKLHPTFWDRPLHQASSQSDPVGWVQMLLRYGADPNKTNSTVDQRTGRTIGHSPPLQALLVQQGLSPEKAAVARALIAGGARVDVTDDDGNTLLHLAARSPGERWPRIEVVADLLTAGVDPEVRNRTGETALDISSSELLSHRKRKTDWERDPQNNVYFDLGDWERENKYLQTIVTRLRGATRSGMP